MSQPSSPTLSRTGSPTRAQQAPPQPRNNRQHRNARPSAETTPPPPQQQSGSGTMYNIANDIHMVQNIKNFEDVSFVEKPEQRMMRRLTKDN